MSAPGESTPAQVVHVFTDEQFKQLLLTVKPGQSTMAEVGSVVKIGAEDVLANIKQLVADAEGTVTHVHGAAKQFKADVKANWVMLAIAAVTIMNTFFIVKDVFKAF